MKFWKILRRLLDETQPNWRDKFLSYKHLKKQLNLLHRRDNDDAAATPPLHHRTIGKGRLRSDSGVAKEAIDDFLKLLEDEIDKFNCFFLEKEEEYVIRWKELQDRVEKAKDIDDRLMEVRREMVDFHGEMVLLENYSALNYIGLVKILKKYDKRSGALVCLPLIQNILHQPFFATDLLRRLVEECERTLDDLFFKNEEMAEYEAEDDDYDDETTRNPQQNPLKVPGELIEVEHMESMYMKLTLLALRVLKDIRSGSSTVSVLSLPPL